MRLGEYYKIRSGVQANAHRADEAALSLMAEELREALSGSGLFHSVEVECTGDHDRLLVAMVGFAPDVAADDVSDRLAGLWRDQVGYAFWSAHAALVEPGHVELQGATRSAGADGRYVTVHLVAQQAEVPAQQLAARAATAEPATTTPVHTPARPARRRLFGRPALAPSLRVA